MWSDPALTLCVPGRPHLLLFLSPGLSISTGVPTDPPASVHGLMSTLQSHGWWYHGKCELESSVSPARGRMG